MSELGLHPPEPRIWGSRIPLRNSNFTGREEILRNLREQMSHGPTAILPHALRGMGGVGKTQLAIEYAYRYRGDYDIVWWVASDVPLFVPGSLGGLAERLGLPSARTVGIEEACRSVLDALRRGDPYRRWLLIFDNANKPSDLKNLIPQGNPEQGHVLITSRNAEWEPVTKMVTVDIFARQESTDFLAKRVKNQITDDQAKRLAEELGDLPLALEQAGALLMEVGMSAETYLELLRSQPVALLGENQAVEYPVSMTAAWKLSITKLDEQLSEALDLLRCVAFFGPEPIPTDLFAWGANDAGPLLKPILGNPLLRTRAIRTIGNYALGKIDDRAIQIHRLIQSLLRDDLDAAGKERYRAEALQLLSAGAPKEPDDEALWGQFSRLVPHIVPVGVVEASDAKTRDFALNVVRYLYNTGDFPPAREYGTLFLNAWTATSGEDDHHVLSLSRHLGIILRQTGRYREAYEINRSALDRARRVLPEDDDLVLALINSVGADLRALGRFAEAVEHDEDSRARHIAKYGFNHQYTLRVDNNLALDYALTSRYGEAVELMTSISIEQSDPSFARKILERLGSTGGLSQAVRLSGDYKTALAIGLDAFELGQNALGGDHYRTLRVGLDVAIARRRLGEIDDALSLARDLYARYENTLGSESPDTVAAITCLANTLRTANDMNASHTLASKAVETLPRIFEEDHPFLLASQGNLALIERTRGDAERALALNTEVLSKLTERLGTRHHYTLTVAINRANDLHALGRLQEAAELDQATYAELVALLGSEHPMTLGSAANLVSSLQAIGCEEDAAGLAESTLDAYRRTLGARHPDTVLAQAGGRLDFDFDPPRY